MISVNEFKTGLTVEVDGGIWRVLDFQLGGREATTSGIRGSKRRRDVIFSHWQSIL